MPGMSTVAAVSTVIAGVTTVVAVPAVLGALGFGSAGVTAGSVAAAVQTPTTAAGSWFAACQSAGVLGVAASTKAALGTAVGGVAGAVTWVAGAVTAYFK